MIKIITLALSPFLAMAEPEFIEANNYPVNFSKCDLEVNLPAMAQGHLDSRDCRTIYVLPGSTGKFRASLDLNSMALKHVCPIIESQGQAYMIKSKKIVELTSRITELEDRGVDSKELGRLRKVYDRLNQEVNEMRDNFRDVDGGVASFTLEAGVDQDLMRDIIYLNRDLTRKGVRFVPMPIQSGYLSITNFRPTDKTQYPSTLQVFVSGLAVHAAGDQQNTYKMSNAASGQIRLGATKACELYAQKQKQESRGLAVTQDDMNRFALANLAPMFHYSYPVMSSVSYKANLNVMRATKVLIENKKLRGQFQVSEFSALMAEGGAEDSFTMDIDLGELSERFTSQEDRQSFLSNLRTEVRDRLSEKMLRELESVNLVKFEDSKVPEAPNGGNVNVPVGTQRRCTTKSFLGVSYDRECKDYTVYSTVWVDGHATGALDKVQNLNITVKEDINIHELVLRGNSVKFE